MTPRWWTTFSLWAEKKFIDPKRPSSLPMKHYKDGDMTWEEYHDKQKKEHPIKYFFFNYLLDLIGSFILSPIDDLYWWLRSHYKQDYKLDLRQGESSSLKTYEYGYLDCDSKILYACHNAFMSHIEGKNKSYYYYGINEIDELEKQYLTNKNLNYQIDALKEQREIYNYWKYERKELNKKLEEKCEEFSNRSKNLIEDLDNDSIKILDETTELETLIYNKDTEFLTRMIKIRSSLWI